MTDISCITLFSRRGDALPYVQVQFENAPTAVITLILGDADGQTASVDWSTEEGGSATAGLDYQPSWGTVYFEPEEFSKTFTVPLYKDLKAEGNETVLLKLTGTNAVLGAQDTATLTLYDVAPPTLQFEAKDYSAFENAPTAAITLTLVGDADGQTASVDWSTDEGGSATAGLDYQPSWGTVYFEPGEFSKTFTVPLYKDLKAEGSETVLLKLTGTSAVLGAQDTATLMLHDVAPPTLQFEAADYSAFENAPTAVITLTLVGDADGQTASVDWSTDEGGSATAGLDYQPSSGTVYFEPGEFSKTFAVPLYKDLKAEGSETVLLKLTGTSAVLGALSTAALTIVDNTPVLNVNSSSAAVCAGGFSSPIHQTTITATLTDGVNPLVGETITFSTEKGGTLDAMSGETDSEGQVQIKLTSSANASEPPDKYLATVIAVAGDATDSCNVEFQPPELTLEVGPDDAIVGEKLVFTAMTTWNGQPVAQHALAWKISGIWDKDGKQIYDGTGNLPADYGSLESTGTETGENGKCLAIFQTGSLEGTVEVTVEDQSVALMASTKNPKTAAKGAAKDLPGARLQSVTFSGAHNHTVVQDNNAAHFTPHWDRGLSFVKYTSPLAYKRNSKMTLSAVFSFNPAPAKDTVIKIKGVTSITGTDPTDNTKTIAIEFPEVAIKTSGGNKVVYPPSEANAALLDKIQYVEQFDITWSIAAGAATYEEAGKSSNSLYVTWLDPTDGDPNHTAIHIGCTLANGQGGKAGSDDEKVLKKIWDAFSNLKTAPGQLLLRRRELSYYGFLDMNDNKCWDGPKVDIDQNAKTIATSPKESWQGLVQSGNGQCTAWAPFLRKILEDQGLAKINNIANEQVTLSTNVLHRNGMLYIGILNWAKTDNAQANLQGPRRKIIGNFQDKSNNGWDAGVDGAPGSLGYSGRTVSAEESDPEAADIKGVPGQGNSPNPPAFFTQHVILLLNGKYYDPGYRLGPDQYDPKGIATTKEAQRFLYEQSAFAGWSRMDSGVYWLHDLPENDPNNPTYPTICTYSK